MRTSSRIKERRVRQEQIELEIAIQLAREVEEEDKKRREEDEAEKTRKEALELALKVESQSQSQLAEQKKSEIQVEEKDDNDNEIIDDTAVSVATATTDAISTATSSPSLSPSPSPTECEAQEVVKKKKANYKIKIKPKIQREEIDISNITVEIVTAKAADIRKSRSNTNNNNNKSLKTTKSHQRQLILIPSKNERSIIYEETAKAIAIKECQALPPYGGRPWKSIVIVSDEIGASGIASSLNGEVVKISDHKKTASASATAPKEKKNKSKSKRNTAAAPLFRWYRGKLELAILPHILDQIDEYDNNHGLLKSVKDEYSVASTMMKGDEKATDLTSRQHTVLSTVAWNDDHHSKPTIERKWISPDRVTFKSRSKTIEHCAMLDDRDKVIDKVLHGIGLRGASIRPVKPTRKQALEAGYYRFLRDGLWVIGQEEEWIKHRIQELDAKHCDDDGDDDDDDDEIANDNFGEINGGVMEIQKTKETNEANQGMKEGSVNDGDQNNEKSDMNCDPATCSQVTNVCDGESTLGQEQKANLEQVDTNNMNESSIICKIATEDEKKDKNAKNNAASRKRKREYSFVPSQHWRLTRDQIDLCFEEIMDFYDKVTYTIKARALHSELADGFDVFRQRGAGRYDMQLPAFDTDRFSFLTDLDKAAWMPVVKKILGDDATIVHKGAFLSMPGSSTQIYHQDGPHLTTKYQRPCHAINVFIPLVDLTMKNGPTEFCIGTHILGYEHYSKEMLDTPLAPAGSPVIFDYRLGHRGLGNSSQFPRPILYLTYTSAKKEFRDSVNFSRKRYRKLGDLIERPLTRQERALKRARDLD